MNTRLLKLASVIILSVCFTYGCQKESDLQDVGLNAFYKSSSEFSECDFYLSESQIDSIGIEHNRLVPIIFETYLSNNEITILEALNEGFEADLYPTLSFEEFEYFEKEFSIEKIQETVEYIIDTMSNELQKNIFNEMVHIVTENTSSYPEVLLQLESLKEQAIVDLTCYELLSTLVTLEVCINSAKLWYSTEAGGEGYYDYITSEQGESTSNKGFWSSIGKIVIGDAIGAFSGFCSGAMPYLISGGAANPISNAILAGQTIRGAVTGSVSAAVNQVIR